MLWIKAIVLTQHGANAILGPVSVEDQGTLWVNVLDCLASIASTPAEVRHSRCLTLPRSLAGKRMPARSSTCSRQKVGKAY